MRNFMGKIKELSESNAKSLRKNMVSDELISFFEEKKILMEKKFEIAKELTEETFRQLEGKANDRHRYANRS